MEEISLFLRILLSTILITSAISKWRDMESHESIITEYRVLPASWSKVLARLDSVAELFLGILLFFGFFQTIALGGSAFLLAVYSLAIFMNLKRGRTEISCGCAGIVGEYKISWLLVVRNLVFIAIAVWLCFQDASTLKNSVFTEQNVIMILSTWILLAIIHTGNKIWRMNRI